MICKNCGYDNAGESGFCGNCGSKVGKNLDGRSKFLLTSNILASVYVPGMIIAGIVTFLLPLLVVDILLMLVGGVFGWIGFICRKPWASLVAAIVYAVASWGLTFLFVIPTVVFGFIGFAMQLKINREGTVSNPSGGTNTSHNKVQNTKNSNTQISAAKSANNTDYANNQTVLGNNTQTSAAKSANNMSYANNQTASNVNAQNNGKQTTNSSHSNNQTVSNNNTRRSVSSQNNPTSSKANDGRYILRTDRKDIKLYSGRKIFENEVGLNSKDRAIGEIIKKDAEGKILGILNSSNYEWVVISQSGGEMKKLAQGKVLKLKKGMTVYINEVKFEIV